MRDEKILIVGAGGIGCEILKSLALEGFTNVTIIDFDTVSMSNLSRQFFYSERDIGEPKPKALAQNSKTLFGNLNVKGIVMDVLSNDFKLDFVRNFNFVFCAVDNIKARERVNFFCVLGNILLIDCASSGKYAQSVPVFPFLTACYSCSPIVAPSGPKITCTIRSTPENYEHCAAWAFHLFNSMYSGNESSDVVTVEEGKDPFQTLFVDRIIELQKNEGMWKSREKPSVLQINVNMNPEPITRITDIWSDEESVGVFKYLSNKIRAPQVFDKDNIEHLAFTTSAANLQALAFHIDKRCSMFDAKGLVSVVEPSLATTNSVISGISVAQMMRMLNNKNNWMNVKSVWMSHDTKGPRLTPTMLEPTNPKCPVCGLETWNVNCNFNETRCSEIGTLIGVSSPSIVFNNNIIYDPDYPEVDKMLCKIENLGNSGIFVISDMDSDESYNVVVIHLEIKSSKCIKEKQKQNIVNDFQSSDYSDIIEIDEIKGK